MKKPIIVLIPDRLHNGAIEEKAWCRETIGDEYNYDTKTGNWCYPTASGGFRHILEEMEDSGINLRQNRAFLFSNKSDATLFKLTWG